MASKDIQRIVIFGSKGWIGNMLLEHFRSAGNCDVRGVDERIYSYKQIKGILEKHAPSHVICTIGRTCMPRDSDAKSRGFEEPTPMVLPPRNDGASGLQNTIDELQTAETVFRNCFDNILTPQWIAHACAKTGVHMSYFGTGCIYHYDDDHLINGEEPWGEDSPPNFAGSNYSAVKSITDQFFHQAMEDEVLNIRIRLPIVPYAQPKNLLSKIIRYKQLYDIPNAYTYLPSFWGILETCMEKKVTGSINFVHREPARLQNIYQIMMEEIGLTTMPACVDLDLKSLGANMTALRSQNAIRPARLVEELGMEVPDGLEMLRMDLRKLPEAEKEKFREIERQRLQQK